jgi:hypothetical protein
MRFLSVTLRNESGEKSNGFEDILFPQVGIDAADGGGQRSLPGR